MKEKKNFKVYSLDEMIITGKDKAHVGPHIDIIVCASPLGALTLAGRKCEHGVYIPATTTYPNHAPYCSLCYPILIKPKSENTVGIETPFEPICTRENASETNSSE
jgi:hypothetical protein